LWDSGAVRATRRLADRRAALERIGGAVRRATRTQLGLVADPCASAASRARLEAVSRTGRAQAGAVFLNVARAGARATQSAAWCQHISGTIRRRPIARFGGIADVRRCTTHAARLEAIARTRRVRAVAHFCLIAHAVLCAADGARRCGWVLTKATAALHGRSAWVRVLRADHGNRERDALRRIGRIVASEIVVGAIDPRREAVRVALIEPENRARCIVEEREADRPARLWLGLQVHQLGVAVRRRVTEIWNRGAAAVRTMLEPDVVTAEEARAIVGSVVVIDIDPARVASDIRERGEADGEGVADAARGHRLRERSAGRPGEMDIGVGCLRGAEMAAAARAHG